MADPPRTELDMESLARAMCMADVPPGKGMRPDCIKRGCPDNCRAVDDYRHLAVASRQDIERQGFLIVRLEGKVNEMDRKPEPPEDVA